MATTRFGPEVSFAHSDQVASRKIADEILLVPIRSSAQEKLGVYTLNGTGVAIWELIDGQRSLFEVVDEVVERFEVEREQALKDTQTFCQDLLSFGAIVEVE